MASGLTRLHWITNNGAHPWDSLILPLSQQSLAAYSSLSRGGALSNFPHPTLSCLLVLHCSGLVSAAVSRRHCFMADLVPWRLHSFSCYFPRLA